MSSSLDTEHPPVTTPPATAPTLRTVAAIALAALFVVGQLYASLPLLGQIGTDLDISSAAVAWVSTVFGFSYAAGMLVAGPLSDTYGRRKVGVAGLLAAAVTSGIVAIAPTFTTLLISRALQGAAAAFFPSVALAYLTERIIPKHRILALTVTISVFLMAAIVAPLVASELAALGGWRTWFVVSIPVLLIMAGVNRMVLHPDHHTSTSARLGTQLLRLPRLFRHSRLVALYVTTLTVMWVYVGVTTLARLAGPGTAEDAAAMQLVRLATLPVFLIVVLCIPLLERVPGPTRLVTALLLVTAAIVGTGFTSGPITLAVALAVTTAGVAVIAPAMVETIGMTSPAEQRGSATAVYGSRCSSAQASPPPPRQPVRLQGSPWAPSCSPESPLSDSAAPNSPPDTERHPPAGPGRVTDDTTRPTVPRSEPHGSAHTTGRDTLRYAARFRP